MNARNYKMGVSFQKDNPSLNENCPKQSKQFCEFVIEYLSKCHRDKRYKALYHNMADHVIKFCDKYGIQYPYTNDIDAEFCENFIYYLQADCNMMKNTVKSTLERLNAMLHKALLYGYTINNTYKEVDFTSEEVENIYLNMNDITRIYYYEGLTRFLQEIKDLFVIGCCTGLRYSDYSRLNETNFLKDEKQIRIKTKKTGSPVLIPMHKYVREILAKYNWKMPKSRCLQYFNAAIKSICRQIGFTEPFLYERTIGTQVVSKVIQRWELISSHTARRSFATNLFLQGVQPYRIMLITGHTSERAFFKYIHITREENALTLQNHLFFQ